MVLKGDPVSLLCLNINYYMGGTNNIWEKSKLNFGLEYKHKLKQVLNKNDLNVCVFILIISIGKEGKGR